MARLSNSAAPKIARSRNAFPKSAKQENFLYFLAHAQTKVSLTQAATVNLLAIDKLTCKAIYGSLIDHQNLSPPTAEKRLIECGFDIHERQKIYSLPFL